MTPRRIAIFVDGSNNYAATKQLDIEIDYNKIIQYWQQYGNVVGSYYFTAVKEYDKNVHDPLVKLLDHLSYNGWIVITKEAKQYEAKIKGNIDIELCVHAMELREHIDEMVLFSGDGDYCELVVAMQRKGVYVTVVSAQGITLSDDLRRVCNTSLELNAIDILRKRGGPPAPEVPRLRRIAKL